MSSVKLTVSSPRGNPDPPNGYKFYSKGEQVSCKVTSPVTEKSKIWNCTGWSGTGSVPLKGVGTNVTFPLDADSTIEWNWNKEKSSGQAISLAAFVIIIALAVVSYVWQYAFVTTISMGAIGGLVHEIVQSGGRYVRPKTDENGNYYLGSLIGIISGGVAGLLLTQGLGSQAMSLQLLTQAFLAGLALKGVADALNPPPKQQS